MKDVPNKDEIIIIGHKHGWSTKYIRESGYNFVDAYKNYGTVYRIIREVFFRLRLPGKKLFYNKEVEQYKDKILIVCDSLITYDYMRWLKKTCSSCRIILRYDNPVRANYNPNGFLDKWCTKWTSDVDDAKRYNMHLYNGGGYFRQWKITKRKPIYDVFYIGKDKNRLQKLRAIERDLQANGLKTMFYITWERSWQHKNDGIHKPFLPYESVLNYMGESKAILHLLDGAQHGITLRIQESLIHKIKLITDDKDIVKYDFYNPNNIFILGKDNLKDIRHFLDTPYEDVQSDFFQHAFYDQMISEVVNRSIK